MVVTGAGSVVDGASAAVSVADGDSVVDTVVSGAFVSGGDVVAGVADGAVPTSASEVVSGGASPAAHAAVRSTRTPSIAMAWVVDRAFRLPAAHLVAAGMRAPLRSSYGSDHTDAAEPAEGAVTRRRLGGSSRLPFVPGFGRVSSAAGDSQFPGPVAFGGDQPREPQRSDRIGPPPVEKRIRNQSDQCNYREPPAEVGLSGVGLHRVAVQRKSHGSLRVGQPLHHRHRRRPASPGL